MIYEPHHRPLLPLRAFLGRLARHGLVAFLLGVVSLAAGMAGYHHFESLSWRDSFLNAAMLLGGMGQVDPLRTSAGRVFAGVYALYSGAVFLVVAALLLTPVVHRLMHRFHLEEEDRAGSGPAGG